MKAASENLAPGQPAAGKMEAWPLVSQSRVSQSRVSQSPPRNCTVVETIASRSSTAEMNHVLASEGG